MSLKTTNLYASLKRLQNFPLDDSCRFEKLNDAESYVANNKTAYVGQVISVYNDKHLNVNNNGIYIVFPATEGEGLCLERATDEDRLVALENNIKRLDDDLSALSEDVNERISTQLESLANETERKLDSLSNALDTLIGGENIAEAFDTIKEISDFLAANEEPINALTTNIEALRASANESRTLAVNASNKVAELERSINALLASNYLTRSEGETLVKNSSYGYRQLSFSELSSQVFNLPNDDLIIDRVHIFIEKSAADATFKVLFRDSETDNAVVYISNDEADENASDIFPDEVGHFEYILNARLSSTSKLEYNISYALSHDPENNMEGYIGVSYYNAL